MLQTVVSMHKTVAKEMNTQIILYLFSCSSV